MEVQGVLPPKFTPGTQNMGQLAALWKEYKGELYFLASGQDAIDDKQKVVAISNGQTVLKDVRK